MSAGGSGYYSQGQTPNSGGTNGKIENTLSSVDPTGILSSGYKAIFDPGAADRQQSDQLYGLGNDIMSAAGNELNSQQSVTDQSMGYFNPAVNQFNGAYGPNGSMTGYGTGEQAFNENGSSMLNNTQSQDAYGFGTSVLPGNNPQAQVLGQAQDAFSNPSMQQDLYNQAQDRYSGQSNSQQAYGQAQDVYSQPTYGQDLYNQAQDRYSGPSMQQQVMGQAQDTFGQPSRSDQMMGRYGDQMGNNPYLQGTGGYQGGAAGSSDFANYMFGKNSGQLTAPGAMEKFAQQSLDTASDPYYQQLQKQQSAQLDASMNARGGFNSGAALAAQALGNSNLAAQQYHQQADIQRSGQDAQNQRLATGLGYGTGTSASNLAGNVGAGNLGIGAGNTQNSGYEALFRAAQGGDTNAIQQMQTLGNIGQGADQNNVSEVNSMGTVAQNNDRGTVDRMNSLGDLGLHADTTNINQVNSLAAIAQGGDANNLGQWRALGDMAQGAGAQTEGNVQTLGNLSHSASSDALSGEKSYQDAATSAQSQFQDRTQQGYLDAYSLGQGMGDQLQQGQDAGTRAYNDLLAQMVRTRTAGIGAGAAAGQKGIDNVTDAVKAGVALA